MAWEIDYICKSPGLTELLLTSKLLIILQNLLIDCAIYCYVLKRYILNIKSQMILKHRLFIPKGVIKAFYSPLSS